jgi:hypothetical protein
MPRNLTMGDVLLRCQQRADKVGDDHIGGDDTAEWQRLISEVYGDLFSVVAETGLRYFEYTATLTTDGTAYVDEPADMLSTIRLDYVPTTGQRRELAELMQAEQPAMSNQIGTEARAYALVDDRIYLYPTPPTGQTYELLYIPQAPDLSTFASDDCIDVVNSYGEAFLIWGVAALALTKAKQDASQCFAMQDQYRERLSDWAVSRAFSNPRRRIVTDIDVALDTDVDQADWRFR